MEQKETEPDGYYGGEDEVGEDELDLSFLDEDGSSEQIVLPDKKPTSTQSFAKTDDKALAKSILSLRRVYSQLTPANILVLEAMTAEYIRRGKPKFLFFATEKFNEENQNYLWGEGKKSHDMKLEGFDFEPDTSTLKLDSDKEVEGRYYELNRRQLARTDDYYKGSLYRSQAMAMVSDTKGLSKVQIYLKETKEAI